ncbi:1-phosphatidylinositol 4,5-bisphosphate phosphodiesterase, partial [Gryllus bimaculatus]
AMSAAEAEAEAEGEGPWWWRRVPAALAQGCAGDRWREERGEAALEAGGVLRVDPRGFFLVWRAPDRNAEVVDLCSVSDVYFGGLPKLVGQLARHGEDVAEKTLTVVTGADFVNLTHHNYVFPSAELAQVWLEGLRKITHNHKMGHLSVQTNLLKQWTFVRLSVNARGKVPLQLVVELLAQAPARSERPSDAGLRSERQETLSQALADAGLDRSQVKSVEPEALTFEIFEALYRAACPRPDIDDLYTKICGDDAAAGAGAGAGLSAEKFRAFLNERQRDQRLNEILRPLYSAKHTADLIRALEPSASARANGQCPGPSRPSL